MLVLALAVALVWCENNDRSLFKDWSVPVDYQEDCPLYFGQLQAAAEGDFTLFHTREVHRLGAPFAANWSDWPSPGKELVCFYGLLSKWIGLFQAANLSVLVAYITSALAFYAVCRMLRFRWDWSFMGAFLFAFAYIHAYRNLHHIVHTYSYAVPFVLLSCWLVAFSRQIGWRDSRAWVCLATGLLVGISNPYNANMFGQLMCLALLVQFIRRRRKENLVLGAACIGAVGLAFVASNIDTLIYSWGHGKNFACLQRGYYETELFGLKPTELFLPPLTHHLTRLADIASAYVRDEWYFKGEAFSPYLGWIGIGALLWMIGESVVRLANPRASRSPFPAYLPFVIWIVAYSMIGGLNCLFGFFVAPLFRGSNRYSIYILALALLFLVSRLSRFSGQWPPPARLALAGGILVVGLFDQLPRPVLAEQTSYTAALVANDRAFGQEMESKLKAGSMVFQLPVMGFPEGSVVGGVQSYDLLRPYIHTKTLRFSFGSDKGRPREDWMQEVEKLPVPQMVSTLEKYGFSAIYANRKGWPDQGENFFKQLAGAGYKIEGEDTAHEQAFVLLHPSPNPQLPPSSKRAMWRLKGEWWDEPGGQGKLWAHSDAGLQFYAPPAAGPSTYSFTCMLGSLRDRQMSIELNGRQVWNGTIGRGQQLPLNLPLEARPGNNYVAFKTDFAEVPSKDNPTPRGYVMWNLQINRSE